MSGSGNDTRRKLFRLYSANLSVYSPRAAGIFICPICARSFVEDDVLSNAGVPPKVDIAHVFPRELGGTLVTLECRDCNGRMNRAGDNEMVRLHTQWEAIKPGGRPMKGNIETAAGAVCVSISANGIHAHHSHSSPRAFAEASRMLREQVPLTITTDNVDEGRIDIGMLHTAHLLLFREFAYGYLLTPLGRHIMGVLQSHETFTAPFLCLEVPISSGIDKAIKFRMGVCRLRNGARCLFVALPVADPSIVCDLILLPGLWEKDISSFEEIRALAGTWLEGVQCETFQGGPHACLAAPEYSLQLRWLWRGWKTQDVSFHVLMHAIAARASNNTAARVDAGEIGHRLGHKKVHLQWLLKSLSDRGFLERIPRVGKPFLVRLTPKGLSGIQRKKKRRGPKSTLRA